MIDGYKSQGVVSARRRLIRGTFAAPAVLALHSGSVLAAASNLRCLANPSQATPVVNAADAIMRVRLYTIGNSGKWYLNGADVYGVVAITAGRVGVDRTFLQSSSVWRQVNIGTYGIVTLGGAIAQPGGVTPGSKYIALRFAPGSTPPVQIVGVVDGTSTVGSAASLNCWSSFAGIAP